MYDTLMQMGRWFGYRPGYIDLCRLYTTPDLIDWFGHIAVANEELRREFDHMANVGGTPKDYGLKVRSHPLLLVTSQVKMRSGTHLEISFDGKVSETTIFHRDEAKLEANYKATVGLIVRLKEGGYEPERDPVRERPKGGRHTWAGSIAWSNISADLVREFLYGFDGHPRGVNTRLLAEYIDRQNERNCLTSWTVAIMNGEGNRFEDFPFGPIRLVRRSWSGRVLKSQRMQHDSFVIRRVGSARDEALDLNKSEYTQAFQKAWNDRKQDGNVPEQDKKPSSIAQLRVQMREVRPAVRGLLLVYPLDPDDCSIKGRNGVPIMAFAACFPKDKDAIRVGYEVNNVYWSQEFGSGE
jgi:hypothetical protein